MGQKQQTKFNKSSVDVRQFYEQQLGRQLKGNNWTNGGLCPSHQDNNANNFRVNVQHGGFICYSCGAKGGDIIDYLRLLHGWSHMQAINYLEGSEVCQPERKAEQPTQKQPPESDEATRQRLIAKWQTAKPADSSHSYLVRKRIKPHGIRQAGRNLLIPLRNDAGKFQGFQNINENGAKWFEAGSRKKSAFFLLDGDPYSFIICEGFATGATLHEQTGYQVAVAFDAGNLMPVAVAIRESHPEREIIIAADNDRYRKDGTPRADNPGLEAATKAASSIGAKLAAPEFPDGELGSDFNDLHLLEGTQ